MEHIARLACAGLVLQVRKTRLPDLKAWGRSDSHGWDAGSLTVDLKTRYVHIARFAC
jgi:hypothetical protein